MPQDLPDDIWLEIAGKHSNVSSLRELSLTSKRIRQLALPAMYQTLVFRAPLADKKRSQDIMPSLIRAHMRARSLCCSPERLRHVRTFELKFWDAEDPYEELTNQYFPHKDSDDFSDDGPTDDAINMVSAIYHSISSLVLHMPQLRKITLHLSSMTPFFYVAISACPLLTSLLVNSKSLAFDARIPLEFPRTLHLRKLCYHRGVDYEDYFYSTTEDRKLEELLRHCSLELEELDINSGRLVLLAPHLSNHTHTLRYLFLAFPWESEQADYQAGSMMWDILRITNQLEQLIVVGWLPGSNVELPPDRDAYILPKLVNLSGMRQVVEALTKGADIERVNICHIFSINQRQITQFVLSSASTLRELTIEDEAAADTPQELLSFLQSFGIFRNLEYLAVSYNVGSTSWLGQVEPQESWRTVRDLLNGLEHLQTCHIQQRYITIDGHDLGCPVGEEREPSDRGHPSLEDIRVDFISQYVWHWDAETGWMGNQTEWSPLLPFWARK